MGYNCNNSYMHGNGKEIVKFEAKQNIGDVLCLGSISSYFSDIDAKEVSLN